MNIHKYIDALFDADKDVLKSIKDIKGRKDLFKFLSIVNYFSSSGKHRGSKIKTGDCLTVENISAFIDGRLSEGDYNKIINHLSKCTECLDKTLEAKRLLNVEEHAAPSGLAERAFRIPVDKSGINVSKIFKPKRSAVSLAAAAIFLIICSVLIYNSVFQKKVEHDRELIIGNLPVGPVTTNAKISAKEEKFLKRIGRGNYASRAEGVASKDKKNDYKKDPLLHAGYLYFLLRNSDSGDNKILTQFYIDISSSKVDPLESVYLITQKKFDSFQNRVSALPEKERKAFYEGYILSQLYHSDAHGDLSSRSLEKGKRLFLTASLDEIRDRILYEKR